MNDTRQTSDNRILAAVFVFGSLLVMVVLALGIGIVRALSARPTQVITLLPTPAPHFLIADPAIRSGGTFTLFGTGWPPDRLVFVYLGDPARPAERTPIFSGQTNAQGELVLAVAYPAGAPWDGLTAVDVIVQTSDQRVEAVQRVPIGSVTPTPIPTGSTPMPTASPTPTPTPPAFSDWKGEYFDNVGLSGAPVLVRNDAQVRFNWGNDAPAVNVPADGFSARWTRSLTFQGGTQRLTVSADDGVRVYVDGLILIDEWHIGTGQAYTRDVNLAAGIHTLRVEMYDQAGLAAISFSYEPLITYADWKGEYFANRSLGGSPALIRNDRAINFDWGNDSPSPNIPADGFSARWTRSLNFPGGTTRFVVRVDDGVRLLIDNTLIIDEWHDAAATTYTRDVNLAAGQHTLVLEYFENIGAASVVFSFQPASFAGWKAEYFANRELSGVPVLVRDDPNLDFNWGDGSPASEVPADDFSARWTRTLNFDAGTYLFSLIVDDGARLFLDNAQMIDEWHDGATTYSFTTNLTGGPHAIRVEYFEHRGNARVGLSWARLGNTPTPTVSPSPSPTPTASATPTPTLTLTATASPTATPTPSTTAAPAP